MNTKSKESPEETSNLLPKEECMCFPFEPKVDFRFLTYAKDKNGEEIIPSYVIRSMARPSYRFNWLGKRIYDNFEITMYDPIVPSTMQGIETAVRNHKKWNFTIKILGPVADIVEQWEIKNAKLCRVISTTMCWSKTGDPTIITARFKISDVTLLF